MHTRRLLVALITLSLACGEAPPGPPAPGAVTPPAEAAPPAPPVTAPVAATGSEGGAPPAAPTAAVAPLPDPWGRTKDIRSAVGGGHYAKGVAGGQKYRVPDARTGEPVSVGIPLILMDGDQPRAFPTAAHTGHVLFKARSQGVDVVLDYSLHWDPAAARADGSTGGFLVDGVVLLQRGDAEPAARFVRSGDWWTREDVAVPAAHPAPPPPPG